MSKLIVIGDLHIHEKEPLFSAQQEFFKWFISLEDNNSENTLLLLGDVFDKSKPSAKEYFYFMEDFLKKLKFKEVLILHGNHTWSRKYGSALEPLKTISNVRIISSFETLKIDNTECLLLPYFKEYSNVSKLTMKETYEILDTPASNDFIFGHFFHTVFFDEKIDIDHLNGKRIFGHVHVRDKEKTYLGTPIPTRYDEKNQIGNIAVIDTKSKELSYKEVPHFLDYYEVDYKDDISKLIFDSDYKIIDILNAPNRDEALFKFQDFHIRKIDVIKYDEKGKEVTDAGEVKSIREHLTDCLAFLNADKSLTAKIEGVYNENK